MTKTRRGSKNKSISRSNSESSQDQSKLGSDHLGPEITTSHYTFGLSPAVVVETTDSDNEDKRSYREAVKNEIQDVMSSKDTELSSLPAEPKSRSSYSSSIGYIDEEAERRTR
ncbi:adhesion G-protein coupled receptor G4 [Caerostris extrusa]|uniref:Adhesion G-protein coupled receptor G4 n=1 Tax=Caerostris extrusa TaxID=172846 RepID=A0AAV4RCI2_CAEEX|nr:adhesion G-protein coupled receptor G4 [Caerostris extrusa]